MILLSLASKQIWPHILTTLHLKPERLVFLHSEDANESRLPAERLKKFLNKHDPTDLGVERCILESISDNDFSSIQQSLDALVTKRNFDLSDIVLNITGGNKLMATAAFQWASYRHVRTFYLERRNQITWFNFQTKETLSSHATLNPHNADNLDPVALLRCQLDASEIEREGEHLVLNELGEQLNESELFKSLSTGVDPTQFLKISGIADDKPKKGDALEFYTAVVLLKLGVHTVQRSLRLKVKSSYNVGTKLPHAELDLLFTWGGRLWIVDCKDRKSPESLIEGLKRELGPFSISDATNDLLNRISKELSIGQTKVIKEDLIAIREAGGIQGQVLCIRKTKLPDEAAEFARRNHLPIILKSRLFEDLRSQLFPNAKPNPEQLHDLVKSFAR